MPYVVTAPCVTVPDELGSIHHRYMGSKLGTVDPKTAKHLLGLGMIEEIPEVLPPGVEADDPVAAPNPAGPGPTRPAPTATKDVWVAYIAQVSGKSADELGQLTKDALIAMAS